MKTLAYLLVTFSLISSAFGDQLKSKEDKEYMLEAQKHVKCNVVISDRDYETDKITGEVLLAGIKPEKTNDPLTPYKLLFKNERVEFHYQWTWSANFFLQLTKANIHFTVYPEIFDPEALLKAFRVFDEVMQTPKGDVLMDYCKSMKQNEYECGVKIASELHLQASDVSNDKGTLTNLNASCYYNPRF